ncbi:MAG: 16S rRNA (cytosine(967)-C(5))-methyltransferase RsmB [Congregibacter sp.]
MKPGVAPRAAAARALAAVLQGQSLDRALQAQLPALGQKDKALCQELCYGTLRFYPQLDALLGVMLDRPIRAKDREIKALALIGLYQLAQMRTPAHAAVAATVETASALRKRQMSGMLNAVLRRFQREGDSLLSGIPEAAAQAHPEWLWDALGEHWPAQRMDIAAANNARPPMTLRVNLSRISRDAYLERLADEGIAAQPGTLSPSAITLKEPLDVDRLPDFSQGFCSVQDEAAQMAAPLLGVLPGEHVLDACAAPGGKSGHLSECEDNLGSLTAADISAERLKRVAENHTRLGVQSRLLCADGAAPSAELLSLAPFDAILLDVPCGASGVIRRHPDIKTLRRPEDASGFALQQKALLAGVWPLLAPGGRLLYVTCSVLPEENSDVINAFLTQEKSATERPVQVAGAHRCANGAQLLPTMSAWDGLYFCLLQRDV